MFYRAPGKAVCADVIPFFEDGEYKLFYLRDYRDISAEGEGCPWCVLTSDNLVDYKDFGPVLLRGNEDEQDLYVFTGCCIKAADEYLIYYTGHNPHLRAKGLPEQKILRARSKDLIHWHKDKDFVFQAPEWLEIHDFRDPFVFYDEDSARYCMLLAGRLKNGNPVFSKGVTLAAYSTDLNVWELAEEPFYAPHAYFTHECPDLFKMGDWWYLVFSEFTDKIVTTYRMSKSPFGPWYCPEHNNFDGHAFYAAKSVSDGKRRILFGWNCIKNEEKDDNPWQWGGTIIPHELVQSDDGTLYVKCPDEIKNGYSREIEIQDGFRLGGVQKNASGYILGDDGKNVLMFGQMPENCRIDIAFATRDNRGDFGVILRENEFLDNYYAVKFEPKFNRLGFDKQPRRDNSVHVQADVERYCPLVPLQTNRMTVLVQGSVLEVYVNDKVAMSARMFDYKSGNFGIYTHNTTVEFSEIRLYGLK